MARSRRRRREGIDDRAERAGSDHGQARPRSDRRNRRPRRTRRLARRACGRGCAGGREDLAPERRLAAGRPGGRLVPRRSCSRPLRGAWREGDDARRRGGGGGAERGSSARARGDRPEAGRDERARRRRRRTRRFHRSSPTSIVRSSMRRARASAFSTVDRISAGVPSRCRSSSSSCSEPRPRVYGPEARSSTRCAR